MKKLKINHKANDLIKAFGLTQKRAKAIDTYVSISLAKTGQKVTESFTGAIKTGIVDNTEELIFMAMCIGTLIERNYQKYKAQQLEEQMFKQNENI